MKKKEDKKEEEKVEKKNKKGLIAIIIIVLLLIVIGVLCYFLFFGDKITVNTNGGTIKSELKVDNGEIVELPVIEKEGYKVVAYVNENNKVVKKGSKVKKNSKITPVYVKDDAETVKVTFMDGDTKLAELTLEKNADLILIEDQVKEGYTFGGWLLENGMALVGNPKVDRDLTLKANWLSTSKEYVTITVMTAEEEVVGEYKMEKDTKAILPPIPKKEGYVFNEWIIVNQFVPFNEERIIDEDTSIKPVWDKYECPEGCTVNEDGKTCSKITTADKVTKQGCPSGAFEYYGNCITLKGAGDARVRQCAQGPEFGYKEMYYGDYCAIVVKKVTITACPTGYTEKDGTCTKTEVVNCTKVEQ